MVVLVPAAWSYGHALTRPGTDTLSIRTTEWVKDHGGNGAVLWAERTWYQHHAPKKHGAVDQKNLPVVANTAPSQRASPTTTVETFDMPARPHLLVSTPIAGEGVWQPGPRSASGVPLVFTTFMRPNDVQTSLVTGVAWMDPKRLQFNLYSGSDEPGGAGWQHMAPIPFEERPDLVAAFNSGFKLTDSHGGYLAEGRQAPGHPLVAGQASLVIRKDGSVDVGTWGRDDTAGTDIMAVRQNLSLLIDGGVEAPDLDRDSSKWGATLGNNVFTWRSGVGVDGGGHLIYVGGKLTVHALADVMRATGAVRAMELDINPTWVHFFTYHDDPSVPGGTGGGKLIPQMAAGTNEYFKPSGRDFIAAFARPGS